MQRPFTFAFQMLVNFDTRAKRRNWFVWQNTNQWWNLLNMVTNRHEMSKLCSLIGSVDHITVSHNLLCIHLQSSFISVWMNHYYNSPTHFVLLTLLLKCRTLEFFSSRFVSSSTSVLSPLQTLLTSEYRSKSTLFLNSVATTKGSPSSNFQTDSQCPCSQTTVQPTQPHNITVAILQVQMKITWTVVSCAQTHALLRQTNFPWYKVQKIQGNNIWKHVSITAEDQTGYRNPVEKP